MSTISIRVIAIAVACGAVVCAQSQVVPINDRPNPYQTLKDWAKLPSGRTWGATSAVDIDRDGQSIWVGERCGGSSCATSTLPPVLKFDASGALVKSFGEGRFVVPHGIHVDREGNIWVTDASDGVNAIPNKGHQVIFIDADDVIYVADSLSGPDRNPGWIRGIRIGSAKSGAVASFIPDQTPNADPITAAEGVAADRAGNVYGAIVSAQMLQKHIRSRALAYKGR